MEIIRSFIFDTPQYIYVEKRENLSPLFHQEIVENGKKHHNVLAIDDTGNIKVLYNSTCDDHDSNGYYICWDQHGLESIHWQLEDNEKKRLVELKFVNEHGLDRKVIQLNTYGIFSYLDHDKYLCYDYPGGFIQCRNFQGELIFSIQMDSTEHLYVSVDSQFIYIFDSICQELFLYDHNGELFQEPLKAITPLRVDAAYCTPHFEMKNDRVFFYGLDAAYNYVKLVYPRDGTPYKENMFTAPEFFHFYRVAEHHGKALIQGIVSEENNNKFVTKVVCWMIATQSQYFPATKMFTKRLASREPPLREMAWIDDNFFAIIDAKRKLSKLEIFSISGKRVGIIEVPGYIIGEENICSDGRYLYILSRENALFCTKSVISVVDYQGNA